MQLFLAGRLKITMVRPILCRVCPHRNPLDGAHSHSGNPARPRSSLSKAENMSTSPGAMGRASARHAAYPRVCPLLLEKQYVMNKEVRRG